MLKFIYHIAFNIPSNKYGEAALWLSQKTEVIRYNNRPIVDFPNWNAHAVYFHDADGNIMEFIARHNTEPDSHDPFSASLVRNISEVGVAVTDVNQFRKTLLESFDIPIYDCSSDVFCAVGDEHGLFIIVDYARKVWFPTGERIHMANFKIAFRTMKNEYVCDFSNESLTMIESL